MEHNEENKDLTPSKINITTDSDNSQDESDGAIDVIESTEQIENDKIIDLEFNNSTCTERNKIKTGKMFNNLYESLNKISDKVQQLTPDAFKIVEPYLMTATKIASSKLDQSIREMNLHNILSYSIFISLPRYFIYLTIHN